MNRLILYHYTDFAALDGILGSRELRVNNVLNMNDAAEMQLFMTGIFQAVKERLENAGEQEKALKLEKAYSNIKQKYFAFSVYAASFSLFRDDAAQWERYGNHGKGVCIGFRRNLMQKMTGGAISMTEVFYRDDMREHPMVETVYDLIMASEDISLKNKDLDRALRKAWRDSASFKHPSFASEREIRLVVAPFETENFPLKACYHVAKDRIKKYYPLDLAEMCRNAGISFEELISEIIIGPVSTQTLPILQDYLRDAGLPALAEKIHHSDCPLRIRF